MSAPTVHRYDVEVGVRFKDGTSKTVTREEPAYSVTDALAQAVCNTHASETDVDSVTLVRIGPARELTVAALEETGNAMDAALQRIIAEIKPRTA